MTNSFSHRGTETQRLASGVSSGLSDQVNLNEITDRIIGCAIEVHRHLGPGLLESTYEECLCYELNQSGIHFEKQVSAPVRYKEIQVPDAYRLDLLVEDKIVIELKAIEKVLPLHHAQLLTYLKAMNKPLGLLINFNVPVLKDGITRKKI